MTRGMTAKQNQNASNRKRRKTIENNGDSPSWSDLISEILFSIIMRLGVVDFIAFSGVCKTWRALALSNKNMFMLSSQPMTICISTEVGTRKECWLEDFQGRKFRTIIPHSSGRICVGLVSGYLVLFGWETHDFRLVNPITRHELCFPPCPFHVVTDPEAFRGTLVFSQTKSKWVLVISARFSRTVSFSLSGKQASWTHLSSNLPICDLIFFKGKIYTLCRFLKLYELRLYPKPIMTPLKMKNVVISCIISQELATSGEKLFVMDYYSKNPYDSVEVDFDQMEWVRILKCGVNKLEFWEEPDMQWAKFVYFHGTCKDKNKGVPVTTNMGYFPHKSLDVSRLHE